VPHGIFAMHDRDRLPTPTTQGRVPPRGPRRWAASGDPCSTSQMLCEPMGLAERMLPLSGQKFLRRPLSGVSILVLLYTAFAESFSAAKAACVYRKLNPIVLVMKSAEDGV
jgi:hypothetical protein